MTNRDAIAEIVSLVPRPTCDQQVEIDDLVHDELYINPDLAAEINNQGLERQLEFLLGEWPGWETAEFNPEDNLNILNALDLRPEDF